MRRYDWSGGGLCVVSDYKNGVMKKSRSTEDVKRWIEYGKKFDLSWQRRTLGELRYLYRNGKYPSRIYVFFTKLIYGIKDEVKSMFEVTPLLSTVVFIEIILLTCLLLKELLK